MSISAYSIHRILDPDTEPPHLRMQGVCAEQQAKAGFRQDHTLTAVPPSTKGEGGGASWGACMGPPWGSSSAVEAGLAAAGSCTPAAVSTSMACTSSFEAGAHVMGSGCRVWIGMRNKDPEGWGLGLGLGFRV